MNLNNVVIPIYIVMDANLTSPTTLGGVWMYWQDWDLAFVSIVM